MACRELGSHVGQCRVDRIGQRLKRLTQAIAQLVRQRLGRCIEMDSAAIEPAEQLCEQFGNVVQHRAILPAPGGVPRFGVDQWEMELQMPVDLASRAILACPADQAGKIQRSSGGDKHLIATGRPAAGPNLVQPSRITFLQSLITALEVPLPHPVSPAPGKREPIGFLLGGGQFARRMMKLENELEVLVADLKRAVDLPTSVQFRMVAQFAMRASTGCQPCRWAVRSRSTLYSK